MKIADAIRYATERLVQAGIQDARLDAGVLLSHILERDRVWLITHTNDALDNERRALFEGWIDRRAQREPLQYIVGKQEFWGLEFAVTPDVLIPRPETELVVESAVKIIKSANSKITIVDLCTGSGCIAISLAKGLGNARIFAADTSSQALAVARGNARKHGVSERIRFLEGDLFEPLGELDLRGRVDVITANPPYIRSDDLPRLQPEVRDYEPEIALRAGTDGTEVQHRIIENAPRFLRKNGVLIMEMGLGQAEALRAMAENTESYAVIEIFKDLAGIERVIIAHKK